MEHHQQQPSNDSESAKQIFQLQTSLFENHREVLKELVSVENRIAEKIEKLDDKLDSRISLTEKKADRTEHEWSIAKTLLFSAGGLAGCAGVGKFIMDTFIK